MGETRPALMMKCKDSILANDAKEVWELPWQPNIKRVATDEYIQNSNNALMGPKIGPGGGQAVNDVSYKDTDKIMSVSNRLCFSITKTEKYEYACGINVKDES